MQRFNVKMSLPTYSIKSTGISFYWYCCINHTINRYILMMYFKQIAEGYEDREDFRTMQQLGIEDKRIQQTIQQQMRYIFIVPLIVGTFHTLIAYRLIKQLMTGIGIEGWDLFATSYVAVLVVFVGIYGIIYRITSKIYYKMIKI